MRKDAAFILKGLGFDPITDFRATMVAADNVAIKWLSEQTQQPTEAEIDAAAIDVYRASAIAANRAECSRRIFERYPAGRQLSALAGIYDAANVSAMHDWIAANIAAENTAADLIEAATTVAEVEAVTVAWPV